LLIWKRGCDRGGWYFGKEGSPVEVGILEYIWRHGDWYFGKRGAAVKFGDAFLNAIAAVKFGSGPSSCNKHE
jgi:hypothetical protein